MKAKLLIMITLFLVGVSFVSIQAISVVAQQNVSDGKFESPLPTPTSVPLSREAQLSIEFVAKQQNVSINELSFGSEQPITFPMLERNYIYVTVHHDNTDQFQIFSVLVDPKTNEVEADYNAVRSAENAAYRSKYGKFEPSLFERLQTIAGDELATVTIWVSHVDEKLTDEQIVNQVIARYPNSEKSFDEKGTLWQVDDEKEAGEIQAYYEQLLQENVTARTQPLSDWLGEQNFTVNHFAILPAVSATLPKQLIVEIEKRKDIAEIFLTEGESQPESNIAMPTDRSPAVWSRGITGSNIRIAILEQYNINATSTACLNIDRTRPSTADPGHKSRVAAVAACNDVTLRGMAYQANIADAGYNGGETEAINALNWATEPTPTSMSNVVNRSENDGGSADTALHLSDKAYDYYIRQRYFTGVKSAGNNGGNVTSPGKGYNVITVGNVEDKNTASWSDDEMRSTSSRINPNTSVEKPEVSAPGTLINTVAGEDTGTSFAAPQVAGLAALLMQRDSDLKASPSAVKAIIMASAVHNIEGDRRLSSVDGAGSIDAALADQIAQTEGGTGVCNSPCWWNHPTNITPALGGNIERYFTAIRGERIRVAIAWLSNPDNPPTDTSNDFLLRNFDLNVVSPSGIEVKSESPSNNFEIVEFVASATGQYTIRITRNTSGDGGNELGNKLGIAWTKQATYLPDVRNDGTWTSKIYVRNDGAEPRTILVSYFNPDGTAPGYAEHSSVVNVQPNASWSPTLPTGWNGSAVVDGSEDLSVVVEQVKAGQTSAYTGIRPPGMGDSGWEVAGTDIALPYVYKSYYGYTSDIRLQNVGSSTTNATLSYYDPTGTLILNDSAALNAGGSTVKQANTGSNFYGSLRVQSAQPIALTVDHLNTNIDISTQGGVGGSVHYLPYIFKQYSGWDSCFVIRNLESSATTLSISYYWASGSYTESPQPTLPGYGMLTRCQASNANIPSGSLSARIASTSNPAKNLVIAINQSNNGLGRHMSYNGTASPSNLVILPVLKRDYAQSSTIWNSGFQIQNASPTAANVTVKFYNSGGTYQSGADISVVINPGLSQGFYMPNLANLSSGLWSAVASADQRLVVVGNATCTSGCTGDLVYAYNGSNR